MYAQSHTNWGYLSVSTTLTLESFTFKYWSTETRVPVSTIPFFISTATSLPTRVLKNEKNGIWNPDIFPSQNCWWVKERKRYCLLWKAIDGSYSAEFGYSSYQLAVSVSGWERAGRGERIMMSEPWVNHGIWIIFTRLWNSISFLKLLILYFSQMWFEPHSSWGSEWLLIKYRWGDQSEISICATNSFVGECIDKSVGKQCST